MESVSRRSDEAGSNEQGESSKLLMMASNIAETHHENWDGKDYPNGLVGDHIPIESRITAVADVYDALSSKRPYRPAFPIEKSLAIMEEEVECRFGPYVVEAFLRRICDIEKARVQFSD